MMRVVVPEKVWRGESPHGWVYHLPQGEWDETASFQPIRCGGGIALPWREKREHRDVCSECLAAPRDAPQT